MTNSSYIPERQDVIWLDFEPTKGKEIGKYRPALVLSNKDYAKATGLMICMPISTSIRGALTEVKLDVLEKPSVIASSIIQTLSWKNRKAKFITKLDDTKYEEALIKFLPLIGVSF